MHELEDEPADIQNATAVEEDVEKGQIDKVSSEKNKAQPRELPRRHCCKAKSVIEKRRDCCEEKRRKHEADLRKTQTVHVLGPACKVPKIDIIPRHCMTKEEYLEFLAKPKERCEPPCEKKAVQRRLRPVSPRIEELARPHKRRLMITLAEQASMLRPEMIDNLIELLEGETALSPEQAEDYMRDRALPAKKCPRRKKRKRSKCEREEVRRRRRRRGKKCSSRSSNELEAFSGDDLTTTSMEAEATQCQYLMALRFVRSILNWNCEVSGCEYRDIAEVVLERLSDLLEYEPLGEEDRKSRQMRLLADLFGCWIAGVLIEVSERRRADLEAECQRKRKEAEELAELAKLEAWYDADLDLPDVTLYDDDLDDDDDDADLPQLVCHLDEDGEEVCTLLASPSCAKTCADVMEEGKGDVGQEDDAGKADAASQCERDGGADGLLGTVGSRLTTCSADEKVEEEEEEEVPEIADGESQTEVASRRDEGTCTDMMSTGMGPAEAALSAAKSRQAAVVEKLCSRMSQALGTDVPFLSFAKILETIYTMIECEAENKLCDCLTNRLHRAVYVKLERAIRLEEEALLGERTKDVLDVIAGKLAIWLRCALDAEQIKLLDEKPALVESREVRDWSRWIDSVAGVAEDWSRWIHKVVAEANQVKRAACKPTRQAWQDWTSKFETNALLWRRAHLEALHQQHHNTMMLSCRKVVKTVDCKQQQPAQFSEVALKDTNLETSSKIQP